MPSGEPEDIPPVAGHSNTAPPPSAAPPPAAPLSLSAEQLAQLLGTVVSQLQRAPAIGAATGTAATVPSQVTAESFPAFSMAPASQPSAGMSLLDLFPSVKAGVLLDIARHDFEPGDLYKLDSKYRDKAERSILDLTGSTLTLRTTSTKDYPSFHSLFPPLTVYFRILTSYASSGNREQ